MVQDSGFRIQGSWFMVQGSGFMVHVSGFRVQGSGFRVQISWFRIQGSGFRDEDSGLTGLLGGVKQKLLGRSPTIDNGASGRSLASGRSYSPLAGARSYLKRSSGFARSRSPVALRPSFSSPALAPAALPRSLPPPLSTSYDCLHTPCRTVKVNHRQVNRQGLDITTRLCETFNCFQPILTKVRSNVPFLGPGPFVFGPQERRASPTPPPRRPEDFVKKVKIQTLDVIKFTTHHDLH